MALLMDADNERMEKGMNKTFKRIFAMVLCIAMCFTIIPAGMLSFADPIAWRVIYNLNGAAGTAPEDPTVYASGNNRPVILNITDGKDVVAPAGKRFAGWTPVEGLADIGVANAYYAPGKTMVLSTNATSFHGVELFAAWEDIPNPGTDGTYTVKFRTKVAAWTVPAQEIAPNGKVIPPAAFAFENYEFEGWYTDSYFRAAYKWDLENDVVTKDITLHAKWKELKYASNGDLNVPFTVTYHLSEGVTGTVPAIFKATETNEGSQTTVRDLVAGTIGPEGKIFAGWSTDPLRRYVELKPGDALWVKHEGTHLYDMWLDANPIYSNASTVKFNDLKQRMTGMGDSVAFHRSPAYLQMQNKFRDAGVPDAENPALKILKLAYDPVTGAGMDVFRVIIGDGGIIDPVNKTKWGNQYSDGPSDSVWPEPGLENLIWVREDWANNPDKVAKFDEDQVWFMKELMKINPDIKINAASWTAPYWMKSNLNVRNDSPYDPYPVTYHGRHDDIHPILGEDFYDDFAQYLVEYAWGMYAWLGIPIYALSPTNEPEIDHPYSAMVLHGDDYERFLLDYLKPAFDKAIADGRISTTGTEKGAGTGYGAVAPMPHISAPEGTRIDRSTSPVDIGTPDRGGYGAMMAKDSIKDFVDIFGTHVYEYTQFRYEPRVASNDDWAYPTFMNDYAGNDKNKGGIWMNELSRQWATYGGGINDINMRNGLHWARLINNLFASEPGFSSYQFWFGITGGFFTLRTVGTNSHSGQVGLQKRFYTLAQYSKFIDDGYYRVGVTERVPFEGGNITAYKNNDDFSIVVLNEDSVAHTFSLTLDGNSANSIIPHRTSENENVRTLPAIAGQNGVFTITMPAYSITTFTNDKGANSANGMNIRDGFSALYAADNDGQSVAGIVAGENGITVSNGSWIKYGNFNFGDGTLIATSTTNRTLRMHAGVTPISGGVIEARIDSPDGMLVGLIEVPAEGAVGYFTQIDTGDTAAYGFKDLYLVFKGDGDNLFTLDTFRFDGTYVAIANNLVVNGVFANANNWSGVGATIARTTSPARRSGSGSLNVTARAEGSYAAQTITGLEAGAVYKVQSFFLPPIPAGVVTNNTPYASTFNECGDAEISLVFYKEDVAVSKQIVASRAKVTNVEWAQVAGTFTYNPPADFDTVQLQLSTSTTSNFLLSDVSLVKIADDTRIVSVTPAVKDYVAGFAANIKVTVVGDLDGVNSSIAVVKDGIELGSTALANGVGIISVPKDVLTVPGEYDIIVKIDGVTAAAKGSITVVEYNANIWSPTKFADSLTEKLSIRFNADIAAAPAGINVSVAGVDVASEVVDGSILATAQVYKDIAENAKIVISGVKYPTLFPSYSFTFTL